MKDIILSFLFIILFDSCIDRIDIKIPDADTSQLVVEGLITDGPGPYVVRLSRASRVDKFLNFVKPITAASVAIADDSGNEEILIQSETGIYKTKPDGLRGVIGRKYQVRIKMLDGSEYESIPDRLDPVGSLDSLYKELVIVQPIADPKEYGFRIYADAGGLPGSENLIRWKFSGVYQIESYPLEHTKGGDGERCIPDPRSCGNDGPLGFCTCCTCWVHQYEDKPHISDDRFVSNNQFKKIEVGYVPIVFFSFQKKYRITVEQMSLSRIAFDYWRIIQTQKEGASSLFQPPTGKARTNIIEKDGRNEAVGIFYASSIRKKELYITNAEVNELLLKQRIPRWDCQVGVIAEDCRLAFPFSTTTKPADWQ